MLKNILLAFTISAVAGCSTVQTQKANIHLDSLKGNESFQLLVQTGNSVMDKLVYEMIYLKFSNVLPLREKEPYTGVMEVTFASSDQSAFFGGSNTVGNAAYSGRWYKGGANASIQSNSATLSSGSVFTWQNSTMMIQLKKMNGERLWSADYNYKGGWEMSGWIVNTPDEAARLVSERLRDKFDEDFQINAH